MRKVLIIAYYWPPSGGGGVQRWLKFVKYLPQFGWEPIVYVPENPEYPSIDYSLLNDVSPDLKVIKRPIFEPYNFYKRFIGLKKSERLNTGFLSERKKPRKSENIAIWIRGNFFIPDARKFWVGPSIKYLSNYLKNNPVDAVVSTGPPHSMHLIALGLKKKFGLKWIADFRDPWTNIDFFDKLMLTSFANKLHHRKERQVIKNADILTTVSWKWAEDFKEMGAKHVEVITNGFDADDFNSLEKPLSKKFELCHLGSMNKDRNPNVLWESLSEIAKENEAFKNDLKITLIGPTDHRVVDDLKKLNLSNQLEYVNYLPHNESLKTASRATILLLPLNDTLNVEGRIPGKIFEYLALEKPILCIGPINGDSAKIIRETNSGQTIGFSDKKNMVDLLLKYYSEFKKDNKINLKSNHINTYSREELTKKMVSALNAIVG